jgi:hypothetical protein
VLAQGNWTRYRPGGPDRQFNHRDARALGFLLLIGATLIRRRIWLSFSQGLHLRHDGLSAAVEGLNMLARRTRKQPPK